MSQAEDRRRDRRVILGPGHAISFRLKGLEFREVRITNLGTGGCFALVGAREAHRFTRGAVLEGLVFLHPDLPRGALQATVSFVLEEGPGRGAFDLAGIGLQFLAMDPPTQAALDGWVEAALAPRV